MSDKNKLSYLDGIRGIAAFLVFIHHFLLVFYTSYFTFDPKTTHINGFDIKYGQSVFSFISNGNFCVCIFFVLSGFVLSRKYFQSNHFELLVSGAMRRYPRLFIPVVFITILVFIMVKGDVFMNAQVSRLTHSEWWFGDMWNFSAYAFPKLIDSLKVTTMFFGDNSFDTTLWTMTIELAGSMFVFAFLALTHKIRNKIIVLLIVIIYAKWTNQINLLSFLLGISLNYTEQYIEVFKKRGVIAVIASILLIAGLIFGSYPSNDFIKGTLYEHAQHSFMRYSIYFHTVGAYFVVFAFVISTSLQHIVSLKLFRFLGRISFSFYLLHPLVIGSASSYVFLKLYQHISYNRLIPIIFIITTLICLLLSWLMTKYIDEPGIKFSKWMYGRWFKPEKKQIYMSND